MPNKYRKDLSSGWMLIVNYAAVVRTYSKGGKWWMVDSGADTDIDV